jgi:hypothetical protein
VERQSCGSGIDLADVIDRMHGLLMDRADALIAALKTAQRRPSWRRSRM